MEKNGYFCLQEKVQKNVRRGKKNRGTTACGKTIAFSAAISSSIKEAVCVESFQRPFHIFLATIRHTKFKEWTFCRHVLPASAAFVYSVGPETKTGITNENTHHTVVGCAVQHDPSNIVLSAC